MMTPIQLPRNPESTDSIFLIGFEKDGGSYYGMKIFPGEGVRDDFLDIGKDALEQSRDIHNTFDPDAGDDGNKTCIAKESDIWDDSIIDIINNYQNLPNLDDVNRKMFNLYAIIFDEGQDGAFAILKRLDITRTAKHGLFAVFSKGEITQLTDSLIQISTSVDMLYTRDALYVLNFSAFNYLFRSLKGNEPKIDDLVDAVASASPGIAFSAESLEFLKEGAISGVRLANKLDSVVRRLKRVHPDDHRVTRAIACMHLQNDIHVVNGKIIFARDKVDVALKLLNDDYFISLISEEEYAASSKKLMTNS